MRHKCNKVKALSYPGQAPQTWHQKQKNETEKQKDMLPSVTKDADSSSFWAMISTFCNAFIARQIYDIYITITMQDCSLHM